MAPFCNLFIERPSYHLFTRHKDPGSICYA